MHALVASFGTIGDNLPFLALGHALARRGHRVTCVLNARFETEARELGLGFVPLGTAAEWDSVFASPAWWDPARGPHLYAKSVLVPAILPLYGAIEAIAQRERVVLACAGYAFGAQLARRRLGLPLASIFIQPGSFAGLRGGGAPDDDMARALRRVEDFALRLAPPTRHDGEGGTERHIGLFPRWYAEPAPDWPRDVVLAGFPLFDGSREALPADLAAFLDAGAAPIVVTFGSSMPRAKALFRAAATACSALGRRGVLVTPFDDNLSGPLPVGFHRARYAPFGALFRRAACVVHHGGIGTAAQALAAGVPQLVVPHAYDQPDNARRLMVHGVALALAPGAFTADAAEAALRRLLDAPDIAGRCRALAAKAADENSLDAAIGAIETLGSGGMASGAAVS